MSLNPRPSLHTSGPVVEVSTTLDLPLRGGGRRTVSVPTGEAWEASTGAPLGSGSETADGPR